MNDSIDNEVTQHKVVIRLGNAGDQHAIDDLRRINNPRISTRYSLVMRDRLPHDATLVADLLSGELAASIQVGVARTQTQLKLQLGARVPSLGGEFLVLTIGHSCSLPSGGYLDALRRVVIHMATHWKIEGRPVDAVLGMTSATNAVFQEPFKRLGYSMLEPDSLISSQLVTYLPAAKFMQATAALGNDMFAGRSPFHEYRGEEPFVQLRS